MLTAAGGVSLAHAARMGATVPAQELGLGTRKGRLLPGYDADVAAFRRAPGARLGGDLGDPPGGDLRCVLTMVGGEVVYRADGTGS